MAETSSDKITNPARKLFFGLFVFPLIIAVGMAVLLCGVVLLTAEKETPETLIGAIKSGSPSKRWEKAFELSNDLSQNRPDVVRDARLQEEIIYILGDGRDYDPKTRSYMAMALSHFPGPRSVSALRTTLKENSDEVRTSVLWALGAMGAGEASGDIEAFLTSDEPELRKVSVYILGAIGKKGEAPKLRPLLNDSNEDVRWNAALALARLGDSSGYPVLVQMTDRAHFSALNMDESQTEPVMLNAIRGLALIQKPESIKIFKSLAQNDKNMKVRQAAIEAMHYQEKR